MKIKKVPVVAENAQGAGRPKGTTGAYKTETKKMYSFRLSKIEHEAVRKLLNEMRKKD